MVKQSSTGRYLVKPHNPWRQWTVRVSGLLVLLAVSWGFFEVGVMQGGHNRAESNTAIDSLNEQVEMLTKRIDELTLENAQLASDRAIDFTASEQVSARLRELNEETLELKEELVFYRSLLSPADLEPGLQILGVKLIRDAHKRTYNYKIVLTQRRNRNRHAKGRVEISINGAKAGDSIQLQASDMLEVGKSELGFRFKNFQSLEGQLKLPDSFQPQELIVSVIPSSRSLKKIKRNYEWDSIVTGG